MNQSVFQYQNNYYGTVLLNPSTLSKISTDENTWKEILSFHDMLVTDAYVEYLNRFYRESINRFGANWVYMDIVNVLYSAAKTLKPQNYLEIGVRRGRSLCTVVHGCPTVNVIACDMWIQNYAGIDNPGPEYVISELQKHNFAGKIQFINGNSHETLPAFFAQFPDAAFDMITVDGDHSEKGAYDDLCTVVPHLALGGILIFDDIAHPDHPYLLNVWRQVLDRFSFLSGYEFTEIGYGVAFAIRRK